MTDLFSDFSKHTLEDWKQAVVNELKTRDAESLVATDTLEGLTINPYLNSDSLNEISDFVNAINATHAKSNDWKNMSCLDLHEIPATEFFQDLYEKGVDTISFTNDIKNPFQNWAGLFSSLTKQRIEVQIELFNISDLKEIIRLKPDFLFRLHIDPLLVNSDEKKELYHLAAQLQVPCFRINAFAIQQCGANAAQEIAFALSTAHQTLVDLMENGMGFVQAYRSIYFHFGAGSDFFLQSIKLRVFRLLWKRIAENYSAGKTVDETEISVLVGHLNKSLADPYTNLLRQTTEALSSINGLIDCICILPYDSESMSGKTDLSERMARNLPLILKHESFLNPIKDPISGSYSLEQLSYDFAKKSWELFQKLENEGSPFNEKCQQDFLMEVADVAKRRIASVSSDSQLLIGINKFPNPQAIADTWKQAKNYLGLPYLRLESSLKNEIA